MMLKQFTISLVILMMIVTCLGTASAAPGVTGVAKTMSDIGKSQQVPGNIDEMKITFRDQTILMTYIRAIDQAMIAMSLDQMKLLTRSYLVHQYSSQIPLETKDQMMISIDKMMLFMSHDQLSIMLENMISMMTKEQINSMIQDNNNAVTKNGVDRFSILQ
jgi:hypothetical protein